VEIPFIKRRSLLLLSTPQGGGSNEKRLFPVKEPPEGVDSSRRLPF